MYLILSPTCWSSTHLRRFTILVKNCFYKVISSQSPGLTLKHAWKKQQNWQNFIMAFQVQRCFGGWGVQCGRFWEYLEIITNVCLHPLHTSNECCVLLLKSFLSFAFNIKKRLSGDNILKWGPNRMDGILHNTWNALQLHAWTVHFLDFFVFI